MRVMKFGGTSVGRPENYATLIRLVRERAAGGPLVVVVSALAGVTNELVRFAAEPDTRAGIAAGLIARHRAFAAEAGLDPDVIDARLAEWDAWSAARRAGAPLEGADRDRALAFGEQWAAELVAAGLRAAGVPAAAWSAGDAGLVTDDRFGAAHPLDQAGHYLRSWAGRLEGVAVVTGFIGRTEDGRITTLGRGGSDYSAAVIGAAIGADEIQIWTDTSGLLSADPRIVPDAAPVPRLSFAEASELAYFGAKVLHPKTLLPAIEHGIAVRVLNTARPDDPGSLIAPFAEDPPEPWGVRSIASKRGITAITIVSTRMLLAHGFLARVFEVFGRHHLVVDLVTTSEVSISVTVDDVTHLAAALAELEGIGHVEVKHGLAVVAVVGERAPRRVGLAGRVFEILGRESVVIEMISQGASRVNLSFVIAEEEADRVVRALHAGLGLGGVHEARNRTGSTAGAGTA
jgi:aspartate kinase